MNTSHIIPEIQLALKHPYAKQKTAHNLLSYLDCCYGITKGRVFGRTEVSQSVEAVSQR
jgi:hypothetical protein